MRVSKQDIRDARERLDKVADVYWGLHSTMPARSAAEDPDQVLERVLADFALVGKTPIDVIKGRAKNRLKEKHAPKD